MRCSFRHFVILTTFVGNYLTLGMSYAMPAVFYTHWLDVFGADAGRTSLVTSLNLGLVAFMGVVSSIMTRRFGFRITVAVGAILSTAGLLTTCLSPTYHVLLVGYGIITGIGWGISYTPVMTAIAYYYDVKFHGILLGFTTAGAGTAVIVAPLFLEYLIQIFAWRGAVLIQVGLNLQLFVCAMLLLPNDAMRMFKRNRSGRQTEIFKDWRFINLCLQQLIFSIGLSVVFVHLAYSVEMVLGASREKSVFIVSISGIATTVSRLFVGALVKLPRVNSIVQYAVQCGLTGAAVVVVPFVRSYELMSFVAVVLGFGYSVYGPVLAVVVTELVGPFNLTAGWGGVNIACGIGLAIGAPIAGLLYDSTLDYNNSLYFGGVMMLISMVAIAPILCHRRMSEIQTEPDEKSHFSNSPEDEIESDEHMDDIGRSTDEANHVDRRDHDSRYTCDKLQV